MFNWIKTIIKNKNEERHIIKLRSRIKNTTPTIISNNCIAGIIYHNLGLKFFSPTINLYISGWNYILFVENLEDYLKCELIEKKNSGKDFPVGILLGGEIEDIEINFLHYKTFQQAEEAWNKRKQRVNFDNLFFIYEFYERTGTCEMLNRFKSIKYNKHIIVHKSKEEYCDKEFTVVDCYDENESSGKIFEYDGLTGKRYLDEFDYVSFLNNKNTNRRETNGI